MQKEIFKFIALPLALKVFQKDKEQFNDYKMERFYHAMIDSIIERLQEDINEVKKELITVHHIDIRYLKKENGKVTYICRREGETDYQSIRFTPEQLRNMTSKVMGDYLHGENARPFDTINLPWHLE